MVTTSSSELLTNFKLLLKFCAALPSVYDAVFITFATMRGKFERRKLRMSCGIRCQNSSYFFPKSGHKSIVVKRYFVFVWFKTRLLCNDSITTPQNGGHFIKFMRVPIQGSLAGFLDIALSLLDKLNRDGPKDNNQSFMSFIFQTFYTTTMGLKKFAKNSFTICIVLISILKFQQHCMTPYRHFLHCIQQQFYDAASGHAFNSAPPQATFFMNHLST